MSNKAFETVAFAYYVNGSFIGWYADTFGSVRATPKLYTNSAKQLQTIKINFLRKMKTINESSKDEVRKQSKLPISELALLIYDSEELLRGKGLVELRMVKCPFYDGPNPEFSEIIYQREFAQWCAEGCQGNFWENGSSQEKKTWIYADMSLVNEWAKQEPTDYLATLKYELGK